MRRVDGIRCGIGSVRECVQDSGRVAVRECSILYRINIAVLHDVIATMLNPLTPVGRPCFAV